MLYIYARSVSDIDWRQLATSIHSYTTVLQPNNMGSSDEGLGEEANVRRKVKRTEMLVSNMLDGMVGVETTS